MGGNSSKKEFKIEDIPELSTKTILVTGGNAGIGKAIAKVFASKSPAKLIIAGRSQTKVNETVSQFQSEFPSANVVGLIVDLSSFKSIEIFEGTLAETVDRVDILVNNAGIFLPPHSKSTEGFEITLGTNAIGVAYLTRLVIPLVLKSPAPRVVFLGSNATSYVTPAIFSQYIADIGGNKLTDSNLQTYGVSKFYNSAYASALQKKYPNIIFTSAHPGFINSDIQSKTNKDLFLARVVGNIAPYFAKSPEFGTLSTLYCAISPDFDTNKELWGRFFDEGPYGKLFQVPKAFTEANIDKVYAAIEAGIDSAIANANKE